MNLDYLSCLPALPVRHINVFDRHRPTIASDEIVALEAYSNYTIFYLTNQLRFVSSHTLGEFERALSGQYFFRIHKSFVVNLLEVVYIDTRLENYVQLRNGQHLPVARRRRRSLEDFLFQLAELHGMGGSFT